MSRYVVTVDIDEVTALRKAVNKLAGAVGAITPTAGDEVQTEAVVNARCALMVALKASHDLKLADARMEGESN